MDLSVTRGATIREILALTLLRGRRGWRLALATAGLMLHQAAEAAVPVLIGVIVDRAVLPGDARALVWWLGVLAATFVVLSMSYQRASLGMVRVYGHGEHDLRQLTVERALHPRGAAQRQATGEVLSITTSDTFRLAGVAWSIAQQGATIAAILVASGVLLAISVPLGLGVLIGTIAVLWGMQALAKPLERIGMIEQTSVADASRVATDALEGLRIIHGLGAQREVSRRYRVSSAASRRGAVAAARAVVSYESVSAAVSTLFLACLTLAAALMASDGRITVGELIAVVGLAQFLQGALDHVGTFGANWMHKRASARRLHAYIAQAHALSAGTAESAGAPAGAAGAPLHWRLGDGSEVALVEGQMLGVRVDNAQEARSIVERLGYREPLRPGELLANGVDATELGPDAYRAIVTAAPHDGTIFSGTVRDNVTFQTTEIDADLAAATALDDVIDQIGGIDVEVGESGSRLSGGQRQRVLLARALHLGAPVLVLDEPTSALDAMTEQRIARGLRASGRTLVVVTSSPLLLAACDAVVELAEERAA